jgi:hypothetical protein
MRVHPSKSWHGGEGYGQQIETARRQEATGHAKRPGIAVYLVAAGALSLVLGACGRGSGTSTKATSSASTRVSGRRTTSANGTGSLNGSSVSNATGTTGGVLGLTLSQLGSLTNYRFTSSEVASSAGIPQLSELTGSVHSPSDWKVAIQGTMGISSLFDVNGAGYEQTGGATTTVGFRTSEGIDHLRGEAYYAAQLVKDVRQLGLKLSKSRGCEVAGVNGTNYFLGNPPNATVGGEQGNVCIADGSGALVQYFLQLPASGGASGGSSAAGKTVSNFTVTSVGGVAPIGPPS